MISVGVRVTDDDVILETKDKMRPETVLQQTGDNVDMSRRFSDVRGNLAKRSVQLETNVLYSNEIILSQFIKHKVP